MKKHFLGVDVGSGSCKVSLMDEAGEVLASAAREYTPLSVRPGWFEQDPIEWFQAFVACLDIVASESGVDRRTISAVAATGQMKGATFIGRSGQVVRRSILWNDLRNRAEVEELKRRSGTLLAELSLNPFNTTSVFAKAAWLQKNEPRNWEETSKIIFPKDFITYKLTGALQTDVTEASGACFYNAGEQHWWPTDVFHRLSFPREKLPDISPSAGIAGAVSSEASELTGLTPGTLVISGGSDATIESLSIGLIGSHQCKIRLGTAGALVTVVRDLAVVQKGKYYVWSYLIPGTWMLDNNTRSCAQATTWFRNLFFKEFDSSDAAYAMIAQEAQGISAGSDGLFFHPYLLGEDSPYWDPGLRGSFFGFQAGHTRGHFARAVYEGTAFALRDAQSAFGDLSEGFSEYLMVGGGTKNPVWTSIIADVLGIDATITRQADAAKGACMIAAIGEGTFAGFEESIERCVRAERTVCFDKEKHRQYTELFFRYREMKKAFDPIYAMQKKD
ncbi:MAG: FGGY family carbohydrate kinase [Spirochaetia bacterium]|jgi:xylulokinase